MFGDDWRNVYLGKKHSSLDDLKKKLEELERKAIRSGVIGLIQPEIDALKQEIEQVESQTTQHNEIQNQLTFYSSLSARYQPAKREKHCGICGDNHSTAYHEEIERELRNNMYESDRASYGEPWNPGMDEGRTLNPWDEDSIFY